MSPSIARLIAQGGLLIGLALGAATSAGCSRTTTETVESGLEVRYLDACKPRRVEQITLEALGDFATREASFASIDVGQGPQDLDALPVDARLFRLEVKTSDFDGVAIAKASNDSKVFGALVLPRREPCSALSDQTLSRSGAALALTGESDLLITGGEGKSSVTNLVQRVRIDEGKVSQVEPGLFVARAGAAAVRVGNETWILGGVQSLGAETPAFDSFERYSAAGNTLSGLGRLALPRTGLCALQLPDGSVLVAGGQGSVDGPTLDSLERIDVGSEQGRTLDTVLPFGLATGRCLLRDDGLVVFAQRNLARMEWALFDPISESVEELETELELTRPELLVTLPGSRMGFFEVDADGVTTGSLVLRLAQGERVRVEGALSSFAGLSRARAVTLHDGRILLTGARDTAATARLIDPGTGSVRALTLSEVPDQLLLRDDGVVVMLSKAGVTLLREDDRTPYDNPGGTLLAGASFVLSLDAESRWTRNGLVLRALAGGARFDVSGLTYDDVRIELDTRGEVELLLRLENGPERAISLGEKLGPALCTFERREPGKVSLRREGDEITLENGGIQRSCKLDGVVGRVALAVRALQAGAEVRQLLVTRPD